MIDWRNLATDELEIRPALVLSAKAIDDDL